MQEQWARWQPLEHLHSKYSIDTLIDSSSDGLIIDLSVDELFSKAVNTRRVRIIFSEPVYAYRVTDEGKRIKTLQYLSDNYEPGFYGAWTFFTVQDSSYKKWISEESFGVWDRTSIVHYVLICDNPIVDILSIYEPVVTYID